MPQTLRPHIYVACTASHNNGNPLYGCWVNAAQEKETALEQIHDMLATSPEAQTQGWFIDNCFDFDCLNQLVLSNELDLETICDYAKFIEVHGALAAALLRDYTPDDAAILLREHYHGSWENRLKFAKQVVDDIYVDSPNRVKRYFDYKTFCQDLFTTSYFSIRVDNEVHVFSLD